MIEFHYTHNHTPKCSRYKKQTNSYTTHICNRSMFCPVLYTFKISDRNICWQTFQTGILIKVLVLSWKRRWWRLICTLSKSHFAVSSSMSPPARRAAGRLVGSCPHRQSRCAPQFYRAFPFPSLLVAAAQLSRVRPNHPLWDILQSVSHWGYSKLVLGSIPFLLSC